MATKTCVVTIVDRGGMRHGVEVQAGSLFEAACKGLRLLRDNGSWMPGVYHAPKLEIEVRSPSTRHSILIDRLESWLSDTRAVGQHDTVERGRLKELLYPKDYVPPK